MIKIIMKSIFLLTLIIPIIYLQYCIIKNTAQGINVNHNDGSYDVENNKQLNKEHIRLAK